MLNRGPISSSSFNFGPDSGNFKTVLELSEAYLTESGSGLFIETNQSDTSLHEVWYFEVGFFARKFRARLECHLGLSHYNCHDGAMVQCV